MDEKRTTILLTDDSVLNRIAGQRRSAYLRSVVDAHLDELRGELTWLTPTYTRDQIISLIGLAEGPTKQASGTDYVLLQPPERAAVDALSDERERAGWTPEELLDELLGGAHA